MTRPEYIMSYYYAALLPQAFNSNNENFFPLQIVNIKFRTKCFENLISLPFYRTLRLTFISFACLNFLTDNVSKMSVKNNNINERKVTI